MRKLEMEELLGIELTDKEYNTIFQCYVAYDFLFPTLNEVATYYNKVGMNFFENLNEERIKASEELGKVKVELMETKIKFDNELKNVAMQALSNEDVMSAQERVYNFKK